MSRAVVAGRWVAAAWLALGGALLAGGPVRAQAPASDAARLLEEWRRYEVNVLSYLDAMPDSLLQSRPTPEVRTFAEQVEHIALDNLVIVATSVRGLDGPPTLADKAVYLTDKAELRRFVQATFAYAREAIAALPPGALDEPTMLFGEVQLTRRHALAVALEHGVWTLGQTVPYLRLAGVVPPEYRLVP